MQMFFSLDCRRRLHFSVKEATEQTVPNHLYTKRSVHAALGSLRGFPLQGKDLFSTLSLPSSSAGIAETLNTGPPLLLYLINEWTKHLKDEGKILKGTDDLSCLLCSSVTVREKENILSFAQPDPIACCTPHARSLCVNTAHISWGEGTTTPRAGTGGGLVPLRCSRLCL